VAYGIEVSPSRLARIEAAEAAVRALLEDRVQVNLRVRDLGDRARVELDPDVLASVDLDSVVLAVCAAGFDRAEVDPRGFRSGSMNELLPEPELYR
jgi:uncharacterized protein